MKIARLKQIIPVKCSCDEIVTVTAVYKSRKAIKVDKHHQNQPATTTIEKRARTLTIVNKT